MNIFGSYIKSIFKSSLGYGVRRSYGQFGEDALIQKLVSGKRTGIYVDIGAFHPILYSNTYALYRSGWRGFVIEPNGAMRSLYRLIRSRDIFIEAGIGESGDVPYFVFTDGAYNTFDEEKARERKSLSYPSFLGERRVSRMPLQIICKAHGISQIDVLNIDIEGGDFEALASYDWSIPPNVIAVEDEEFNPAMPKESALFVMLSERGYQLQGFCGPTLVWKKARL